MKLKINGAPRETTASTVAALVEELALAPQVTLVEHNGIALRREEWITALAENDTIELLRVAAGG